MKLTVFTPLGEILKSKIKKVTVETLNGYYTLLPKHVDFAAAMGENIVTYTTEQNQKKYLACHRGIVVKKGDAVTITVQNAVMSDTLEDLSEVINHDFKQADEQRKELNSAMARLELGIIRGFDRLSKGDFNGGI